MTVRELIEALLACPQDATVEIEPWFGLEHSAVGTILAVLETEPEDEIVHIRVDMELD